MAGTSQISLLGYLGYVEEAAFAEVSASYDKTVQVRDAFLNVSSLTQEMIPRGGVFGRANQGDVGVPGPFTGASLSFTMDLYGHGTTTAGALTQTPLGRLLGHAVGNCTTTSVGGALTAGDSDENTLYSDNVTGAIGEIIRVGELGDGACEGQATVLSSATSPPSPFSLGVNLPASPVDATDIVYAMQMVYPADASTTAHLTSSSATSNNTLRFVVGSGAQQWVMRGCACTAIAFNGLSTGEVPSVTFTFTCAYWTDLDVAFPSATASADFAPAPVASGSFFYNDVGTVNRVTNAIRNFSVEINHQMVPVMGSGGANANQVIVGWVRGMSKPTITFDVEAQDASANPTWSAFWNTDPTSITRKHVLYTAIPHDKRAVAWYFPNMQPTGNRPTQTDVEGLTYVSVQLMGVEGPTTTNALTRSAWRLGLG